MTWHVYIVRCRDGSLYTGVSTDPLRRLRDHNLGRGAAYTRSRRPVELVWQEDQPDRSAALRRELAIKALDRRAKQELLRRGPAGEAESGPGDAPPDEGAARRGDPAQ